jgi:hypothetical protein
LEKISYLVKELQKEEEEKKAREAKRRSNTR